MNKPIDGQERLIVVMGQPHSGTTIFVRTLATHPQIAVATRGPSAWLYEHDALDQCEPEPIQQALAEHPDSYLALKKPWAEYNQHFFATHLPKARFFCLRKSFQALAKSWKGPRCQLPASMRDTPKAIRLQYNLDLSVQDIFPMRVKCEHFRIVSWEDMVAAPDGEFRTVADDLDLPDCFDTSAISPNGDIKATLRN